MRISLIIISFCLVSCISEEDKAENLIKEKMFKTLYDFESYEPIETIIDSSFTTVYRDSIIQNYAITRQAYRNLIDKEKSELEDIGSSIEIWAGSRSSLGRRKIQDLKKRLLKSESNFKAYYKGMYEADSLLKVEIAAFTPIFVGFQAKHKFRAKNKGGNFTIGNYLFVFDEKFTTIKSTIDLNDENESEIKTIIDALSD